MSGSAVFVPVTSTSEGTAWPAAGADPDPDAGTDGGEVGDGPQGGLTGVVATVATAVPVSLPRVLLRSANGSGATTGAGIAGSTYRSVRRSCAPTLLASTDIALAIILGCAATVAVLSDDARSLPPPSVPRSCWCPWAVSASASMTDERAPPSQLL